MLSVGEILWHRVHESGGATALVDATDGSSLTWREVGRVVDGFLELVRERNFVPGTRVAIAAEDPLLYSCAYVASLAGGLCAAPIDSCAPDGEAETAVARLKAAVVVSDRVDIPAADSLGLEHWRLGRAGSVTVTRPLARYPSEADLALRPAVLSTRSGTTGIPLSERQLLGAALRFVRHHRLQPGDRGYSPLSLVHVSSQVVAVLSTLISGGSIALDWRSNREEYWSRVAAVEPTWLNTVPAILASMGGTTLPPPPVIERVRFARSASAPLSLTVLHEFEDHTGIGVLPSYGIAEAASQITASPLAARDRRPGSVGLAVGVNLRIDHGGAVAGSGEMGVVQLSGQSVVTHYLELSADTLERVRPARIAKGWLSTGDLGYLDDDGFLYLAGRVDDMINRGGEQFHPKEVEEVLCSSPLVDAAVVVAKPHLVLGEVPVAFIQSHSRAGDRLATDLAALCAARLAEWKRPVELRFVEHLPFGSAGHVRRGPLREAMIAEEVSAMRR